MDITRGLSEAYKVWIGVGGVALALLWAFLPKRVGTALLVGLVLIAGANYARFGPKVPFERIDSYDVIHYYLNAKYYDELGYFDLYPACILADHENYGPFYDEGDLYMAQDETGHHLKPIAHAVERGRWVKEHRFTPESWAAFSADFLHLQRGVPGLTSELWRQLIQDHGFNGTVGWTVLARPFSLVPVQYVKWLGWIDVVLLGVGIGALGWAYGRVTALWTLFWLFVTYSARWPTYSWAFLRYDYVTALMLGMALLKKEKPFWAGAVTGWATALRMFPVTWLYGLGAKGLFTLLVERRVRRNLLVVVGGFVVAGALIQGAGMLQFGVEPVKTHFENMDDHQLSENLSSRRIGLALALPFGSRWLPGADPGANLPKALPKSAKEVIESQKPLRYGITAVLLLVLGWGLRKQDDDEAYAYGFLPFFLITTASYYYYVVRVTLIILHASRLPKPRHTVGLVMLLGAEVFSNWAETTYGGHRVFLISGLAWGLFAYATVQAVWVFGESVRRGKATKAVVVPEMP